MMIKTAAQILAELGDEEKEEEDRHEHRRGGRPLLYPPDPYTTKIMLDLVSRRKALGITQREVARRMNEISPSMISEWELGRCQPTLHNLVAYTRALGGRVVLEFDDIV